MRPFYYVALIVVLAAGLVGGALLLPDDSGLGLMYFKDRQYAAARSLYEKRLAAGETTGDVVAPLAELYVQAGEIDRAVDLLGRLQSIPAEKLELFQRIGKYQQYTQRREKYVQTLETINGLHASENTLRELATLYRYANQDAKLIESLEAIVARNRPEASDFLELANLLAAQGLFSRAAAVMEQFEAQQPHNVTADAVELLSSLYLDTKQDSRAAQRAARWLEQHPDPGAVVRFAGLFHRKGHPGLAAELLAPFDSAIDQSPALLGEWVEVEMADGRDGDVISRLDRLHEQKRLPGLLQRSLLDLAISKKRSDLAIELAEQLDPWLAARLAYENGRKADVARNLRHVALESQPESSLLEIARMWLEIGNAAEGAARFDGLRVRRPSPAVETAWALAAAGTDRGLEVARWLERSPARSLSGSLLRDLYFLAQDRKQADLALVTARLLMAGNATPEAEQAYTNALLGAIAAAGRQAAGPLQAELRDFWAARLRRPAPEERQLEIIHGLLDLGAADAVLPQLAKLAHRRIELAPLFIETALKAGRKAEMVAFVKSELQQSDLPRETREAGVYVLLEHGAAAEALPHIRRLAGESPAWVAAYEDVLRKLGRTGELAEFLRQRAVSAGVATSEKRAIAFQLLETGHQDWAITVFTDLARTAKPADADVNELLFLWGVPAPSEALDWLEERARRGPDSERADWLTHLMNAGASQRVIAIAAGNLPPAGRSDAVLDIYLRALAGRKETAQLASLITRHTQASSDPEHVRRLARLARDAGENTAADTAYGRLLALSPTDTEARHWLGSSALRGAQFTAAERYFGALLAKAEGGHDDNFYYAEILWRKGDRARARAYYARVLQTVERLSPAPLEAQIMRAQALFRCGSTDRGLEEFRRLVAANPRNGDLRADFAALLLESGLYREARGVLRAPADSAPTRLALLRAQFLVETAHKSEALGLLENLSAAEPASPQVLAHLGLLEQNLGRSRKASAFLDRAAQLDSGNEDIAAARASLAREVAPQIRIEGESRAIEGAQSENLLRILAEHLLSRTLRLRVAFDRDQFSAPVVHLATGGVVPLEGVRQRGEASVEREWSDGTRLQGSLFTGERLGAGAAITRPDAAGETSIRVEAARPYWDFAESLAQAGVRDRVEVRRETSLGPAVSVRLAGALNRYGLQHAPGTAESAAATAAVAIKVSRRPQVNFEYYLDAEYPLSVDSRPGADGRRFQPLPLIGREVHGASVGTVKALSPNLQVAGAAGIAMDRYGGRAPFASFHGGYRRGHFEVRLDFDRRLYFLDSARTVTSAGGGFSWHF
ncbi:MAG: hypothetical protein C5B51_13990 [Terriglobia bacterium]|nr:MAG: hypothetical protein C5B51_13990 [Terriglobia bacterium]